MKNGTSEISSSDSNEAKIKSDAPAEEAKKEPVFTLDQVKSIIQEQFKLLKQAEGHDDTKEKMSDLIQKVAEAKARGSEWVETTQENIDLLQPNGMGRDRFGRAIQYFCWQGVKVCLVGKVDEIERDEAKTVHDRMHPESRTQVISGAV
jgi:hypothetical protein